MVVVDLRPEHDGTYTCEAKNEAGTAKCKAELFVEGMIFSNPCVVYGFSQLVWPDQRCLGGLTITNSKLHIEWCVHYLALPLFLAFLSQGDFSYPPKHSLLFKIQV